VLALGSGFLAWREKINTKKRWRMLGNPIDNQLECFRRRPAKLTHAKTCCYGWINLSCPRTIQVLFTCDQIDTNSTILCKRRPCTWAAHAGNEVRACMHSKGTVPNIPFLRVCISFLPCRSLQTGQLSYLNSLRDLTCRKRRSCKKFQEIILYLLHLLAWPFLLADNHVRHYRAHVLRN